MISRYQGFQTFFIFLAVSLASFGCGGGGNDADGDSGCNCETGLECIEGDCVCTEVGCCLDNSDCTIPHICDLTTHRCTNNGPDGDFEPSDGDQTDGDLDFPDGDDDREEPDGDGCETDCPEADGDSSEDGDADGDRDGEPDGDSPTDGDYDPGACPADPIEWMYKAECLPIFANQALVEHASSHDLDGGNDDRTNIYLYLDGNEHVIMHSKRPGCVTRLWLGDAPHISGYHIKFYLDGAESAQYEFSLSELFGGTNSLFPAPLVGESAESYYSYVPICYESELKISLNTIGATSKGFNITYVTFPTANGIETFSNDIDLSTVVDFYANHIGEDPKPEPDGGYYEYQITQNLIAAGNSKTVYTESRARVIAGMRFDVFPLTEDVLNNVYIQMTWEGRFTPDIYAPLGMFFGSGFGGADFFNTLMYGYDEDSGQFYMWYPMPFWSEAEFKIVNESETNITSFNGTLYLMENEYPMGSGRFQAHYSEELPTTSSVDFSVLRKNGKGHVVGISLAAESTFYTQAFMDGDERIYIDGLNSPSIHGTGTDHFFNGDNKFQTGTPSEPLFSLWKNADSIYRFMGRRNLMADRIPFDRSVRFGMEHWGSNETLNANYRSVSYLYYNCLAGLSATDAIDIGDNYDEEDHSMVYGLQTAHTFVCGYYDGDNKKTNEVCDDRGWGIGRAGANLGFMEMDLAIDPANSGVRLIRQTDYSVANQDAVVYVDGQAVGHWYTAGHNSDHIWRDSIFDIPASFTETKSSIRVKIEYAGGVEWNAFYLWAYSFLPPDETGQGPGVVDQSSISVTTVGPDATVCWPTPQGVPPENYHVYLNQGASLFDCDGAHYQGTVQTNCIEIPGLTPLTEYYVKVQAEDCTGTRGACSAPHLFETGLEPIEFEAEDIFNAELSWPSTVVGQEIIHGDFSGNSVLCFEATNSNQIAIFSGNVDVASTYAVDVTFMKGPDMGISMLQIGGSTYSSYDGWANTVENSGPQRMGSNYLTQTTHNFSFRVTGKNPASTGYRICVDKITLNPIETRQ